MNKEKFIEIFKIFPKGNPESAYIEIEYHIRNFKTDFQGIPLTFTGILKSWKEYAEEKLAKAEDSRYIKSLQSFVSDKDYNRIMNDEKKKGNNIFLNKWIKT